jgi:hypothetical protein
MIETLSWMLEKSPLLTTSSPSPEMPPPLLLPSVYANSLSVSCLTAGLKNAVHYTKIKTIWSGASILDKGEKTKGIVGIERK